VVSLKQKYHSLVPPRQKARPYLQNNQAKRTGGVVHAIDHVPSKHKALNTNPSTNKKKKRNKNKNLKTELLYHLAIPLLGIYPKECKSARG
jgi:hypothetical protein